MALEKQFNTFVKGIVTEANALTFPENASIDEDNMVLNKDGSRQRRLGIDYETGFSLVNTGLTQSIISRANISFHRWDSPGGDPNLSLGIVRIYNKLWFVNLFTPNPSDNVLNNGEPLEIPGLGNSDIDVSFISNFAVIVSESLNNTLVLSYNQEFNYVLAENVPLFVRDIWGVDDGLSDSERPVTITPEHRYNLINQGWSNNIPFPGTTTITVPNPTPRPQVTSGGTYQSLGGLVRQDVTLLQFANSWESTVERQVSNGATAIDYTKTVLGYYPSNSDVWTLGKNSDASDETGFQLYDPNILIKNSLSNVLSPKASLVVDAYNRGQSRKSITGIQQLPLDKERGRCSTVASYASRVFYSGIRSYVIEDDIRSPNYNSYIFFSQIVTTKEQISLCYQSADPTSPDISDIIDTDGGTIQIPEATAIVKLVPTLGSLLVCAENGVWEIYGDTGGFTATSFQTSKITSSGVLNKDSIIEVNGNVFLWGNAGIMLLAPDDVTGRYKAQNLSLNSIQTYYNEISELAKANCKAYYNEKSDTIRWLYNDSPTYSASTGLRKYNKELVLDLTLKAFYPATIENGGNTAAPYPVAYVDMPGTQVAFVEDDIVVGNVDVEAGGEQVNILVPDYTSQEEVFKFLTIFNTFFTFSSYKNSTYKDWVGYNGIGYNYVSYLVTGYDISKDLMRNKQTPYIFCYFKKTEDGFTEDLEYANPSSCMLQSQWDWHNSAEGNKWGTPFQAYRFKRNYIPENSSDTFDNGESVIVSKNKLRGSGKSISLKFSSEEGKGMHILGWAYPLTGDKVV